MVFVKNFFVVLFRVVGLKVLFGILLIVFCFLFVVKEKMVVIFNGFFCLDCRFCKVL